MTLPRTPKARPDPSPMRFTLGLTGLVAATAMLTSIVQLPSVAPIAMPDPTQEPSRASATDQPAPIVVTHVTRYVQLQPGQTAPPGAMVVQKPAASPRVIVVTLTPPPAPPSAQPARRVIVVTTTRQSGGK